MTLFYINDADKIKVHASVNPSLSFGMGKARNSEIAVSSQNPEPIQAVTGSEVAIIGHELSIGGLRVRSITGKGVTILNDQGDPIGEIYVPYYNSTLRQEVILLVSFRGAGQKTSGFYSFELNPPYKLLARHSVNQCGPTEADMEAGELVRQKFFDQLKKEKYLPYPFSDYG